MNANLEPVTQSVLSAALSESSDARRAFHGRGQLFPGLESVCIDLFEPMIIVSLFSEQTDEFLANLVQALEQLLAENKLKQRFRTVLVQHRYRKPCETEVVRGEVPDAPLAVENDHRFELNLGGNQNIGFFLDAKPARDWLRANSADAKVLNLFSYTCALSVAALAGDAKRIANIDMSRSAMRVGERNHRYNFSGEQLADNRVRFMPYEIFRSVSRLAKMGPFDLIVIDPPSFQPGSFVAKSDYAKLLRKLPRLLRRGGRVLAMLNAPNLPPEFLQAVVAENFPELMFIERLENSQDFPDADENRSLKMMVFKCTRTKA